MWLREFGKSPCTPVMLPSPLAWVWGANAWARDGDMSSRVIFSVRLVLLLFYSFSLVLKAKKKAMIDKSIAPSDCLPELLLHY